MKSLCRVVELLECLPTLVWIKWPKNKPKQAQKTVLKSVSTPFLCSRILLILSPYTSVCKCTAQWAKSTYSENSPQIQAAAYNTSQMPIRCMLPVNRWALSSRVAIWATAKTRMALTRIATSSIWEAMRWPWRVPSNRVSSTRILMYLSSRYREVQVKIVSQIGKQHPSLKIWREI